MSDVINDMKKNLNAWWKLNGPKVEDMLKSTAKKTEELTHKAKLKYDIFQAERDLEKKFAELGEYVHNSISEEEKYDYEGDVKIAEFMEAVRELEEKIAVLREEYLKVGKAEDLSHENMDEDASGPETDEPEAEDEAAEDKEEKI